MFFQREEVKPLGQEQNELGQAGSPLVEPQKAQALPPRQRRGPGAGGGLTRSPALLEPRSTQTPTTEGQEKPPPELGRALPKLPGYQQGSSGVTGDSARSSAGRGWSAPR